MDDAPAISILRWVAEAGLAGLNEPELLRAFCERLNAEGVPVARALVMIDTLHPVHEGHVFRWSPDQARTRPGTEYGRISEGGEAAEKWKRSPFHFLLETGGSRLRRRLGPHEVSDFAILDDLRDEGQTDYLALIHRFGPETVIGEMDGVYSSWATEAAGGFSEAQLAALSELVPSLALAIKSAALARIAETLVQTYLGRDAGRRVLSGRIIRGITERIEAVLWYSDLRGFTHITETAAPDQIIPFLNDYAGAIISSVHEAGGDVLKLMGDGTLAIFKADTSGTACRCALTAEALMRSRIRSLNQERAARGLPLTEAYLGLHIGEVFYGNVGSQDRLDFTVVGPAVNEASRIAALCRSVEKDVLISSAFAAEALGTDRARLVSVGRYALKGVERSQELFTLERTD
jgi:adenylate cyclase